MKEQIEKDRENLKNGEIKETGFSYIPFLQQSKTTGNRVKLSKLTTLNTLIYLEEGFRKGDKYMLNNIEKIKKDMIQRADLFEAVLKYLENKEVRDDLFYWTPGYKISNIFCFIVEILPNFVQLYKEYYIEKIVCKLNFYDASKFIKERFRNEYEQFNLMGLDLTMFERCITGHIWTNESINLSQSHIKVLEGLGIPIKLDISDDIEANIVTTASFVDITIDSVDYTVRLDALIGLYLKDEKYRKYWEGLGVLYE